MIGRGFEGLITGQKESRYHLNDAEELCGLDDEEDVLFDLVALLVDRPCPCVDGDHGGEGLEEGGALEEEEGYMGHRTHGLFKFVALYRLYYCMFIFKFNCDLG